MSWRWQAPKYVNRANGDRVSDGRNLGGFATREEAMVNAIYNATLKHVDTPEVRDVLWRSLENTGWTIEPELAHG